MLLSCVSGHTACLSVHHVSSMWGELPSRASYAWTHWAVMHVTVQISDLICLAYEFSPIKTHRIQISHLEQTRFHEKHCVIVSLLHSSTRLTRLIFILAQLSVTICLRLQHGPDNIETTFYFFCQYSTLCSATKAFSFKGNKTIAHLHCPGLRVIIFCQPWHLFGGVKDASTAGGVSVIGPTWQKDGMKRIKTCVFYAYVKRGLLVCQNAGKKRLPRHFLRYLVPVIRRYFTVSCCQDKKEIKNLIWQVSK